MKALNKKIIIGILFFGIFAFLFPITGYAYAQSYPDVVDGDKVTGNTAHTDIGIKIDESQLSFTAPVTINFAMKADGSFISPSDGAAKFTNNSKFDLKISEYQVISDSVAKGCPASSFNITDGSNVYKLSVVPDSSTKTYDFAVSQNIVDSDWLMPCQESKNTLGLSFKDGLMKNITSNTWTSGHPLQQVIWTISAA